MYTTPSGGFGPESQAHLPTLIFCSPPRFDVQLPRSRDFRFGVGLWRFCLELVGDLREVFARPVTLLHVSTGFVGIRV